MVMVFVRKMANFVYLPQHGIQPTCSFTAATTQIMATERTQKKNNFIQLIQHQTSWSLFLFHVCQSFYWIQHLGEISSNMVLPFLLWTTEQVLWTLKSIVNDQMAKNGWWVCSKKILDSWFSYFCHGLYVAIQSCTPVESGNGLQAYKHSWHISLKA